jgi:outer membrane protein assembly factor BamB
MGSQFSKTVQLALIVGTFATVSAAPQQSAIDWRQWGGPDRNFTVASKGLAASWPSSGPRKLWSRPLGEGHSSITVDGSRLYTMCRPGASGGRRSQEEVVAALDASTGSTVWEHRSPSPTGGLDLTEGAGPHSTPLVTADRVFATGSRMELVALNKVDGRLVWSHDLVREFGARQPDRGYACSPLLHGDLIVVSMGGRDQSVAAFNQRTGALAWKSGNLELSPASLIEANVDGQSQLVYFGGDAIGGFDPATGQMLWTHPHKTDWGLNISTPVWFPADHLLFMSSAYGTGSRVLELHQAGGKTTVAEKWFNPRMRIHIGTAIRVGNLIVGSSGDFGPAFLTAVDITSGRIAWQDRTFARAQLLYADGKLVILDEDGTLGLVTVTPSGLHVLAKASVLQNRAWTPPTLVGTKLFVRDRKSIASYELGAQ